MNGGNLLQWDYDAIKSNLNDKPYLSRTSDTFLKVRRSGVGENATPPPKGSEVGRGSNAI